MKTLTLAILALSSVLWAKDNFKLIHTNDLSTLLSSKNEKLVVYDVNGEKTRKEDGVIPGAKLLSSPNKFDVAKELPAAKDSKLVFYCANTKCTASHMAAERAFENGYTDVNVMADGIQGWKKAGKPVSTM